MAVIMAFAALLVAGTPAAAQQAGGIRGLVNDKDFEVPLAGAKITIAELGKQVTGTDQGNYVITDVPPGKYTLVFSKEGYARLVRADVLVQAGQITEMDASLSGEFTEMEELVVQDLKIGTGTEAGLLSLRSDSPALLDSISSELMSQAGAGDAAAALNLVTGATVQDGKFAVIRGLPDRFVVSQINGVRLPSADEDTRSVELDQFPSSVIESIQISKTFTPDQQGDASGGAVNVLLRGIPNKPILELGFGSSVNTQSVGRSDFLSYTGGGLDLFGRSGVRDVPINGEFEGALGVGRSGTPINYDMDMTFGYGHEFDTGVRIGGFFSTFYERDHEFFDNGIDDKYWVEFGGATLTPQYIQGTPQQGDFKTQLFNVTQGSEQAQFGGLGAIGLEAEGHSLRVLYMFTRDLEDTATLAEDVRGKPFFFPGYDVNDPTTPGHGSAGGAPFLRAETLDYTERTTQTLQLTGKHQLPFPELGIEDVVTILPPELDWTVAFSSADRFNQKRQFGSQFVPQQAIDLGGGQPPIIIPAKHTPFKPAENFLLGNVQLIYKDITEESEQYFINLKFPFEQWSGDKGYFKFGIFNDIVTRNYDQETFSNFNNNTVEFEGDFSKFFSAAFLTLPTAGPLTGGPPFVDVDYEGQQKIEAYYAMLDLPLTSYLNIIGGARVESTNISTVVSPEANATFIPPFAPSPVELSPGSADVSFEQDDVLPSLGIVIRPFDALTIRGSYAETVARQTFKELTPVQQQEYLGGDVFIGNPGLKMASVKNYDLRVDYTPHPGGLLSVSYFHKDIRNPIEYVQRFATFTFTTPVNFPKGTIDGFELEVRQRLNEIWPEVEGVSIGGNITLINSEVNLTAEEIANVGSPGAPAITSRDMTNAPEYLYNIYLTYDLDATKTKFAIFYTVKGDTLVAGAGGKQPFTPDVYATEYGTLNLSITQTLSEHITLKFQAKNLTNPHIKEVYRAGFLPDIDKTSYTKGIELSIGISAEIPF